MAVNIKARFYCYNVGYSGIIKNLSEKGMLISTETSYIPCGALLELFICIQEEVLHIPSRIKRIIKLPDFRSGLGIELNNPPKQYLDYLHTLECS